MHTIALILIAVFTTGNLLADSPAQDRLKMQAAVDGEKIPTVASRIRPNPPRPRLNSGYPRPHARLDRDSRSGWDALRCALEYGTNEEGMQVEDALKCVRCPRLCGHFLRNNLHIPERPRSEGTRSNKTVESSPPPIPESLLQAAEQGEMEAQYQIGQMFYYGQGVAQDYNAAEKWFRRAAEQGHLNAQNSYAFIYAEGRGFSKDPTKAAEWFRRAAEKGLAKSQSNLGMLYRLGEGVSQDHREAVKWFRRAAEQGYPVAQYQLGAYYLEGQAVEQDDAESAQWIWLAAEQGNNSAQYILGMMYHKGRGVLKNQELAAEWFRRAAEKGHLEARRMLAELLRSGNGISKDSQEAERLMKLVRCSAESKEAVEQTESATDDQ